MSGKVWINCIMPVPVYYSPSVTWPLAEWMLQQNTKARLHQRQSNLGSTEPRSPVNGDLNRVRVAFCCTNLNLVQQTVDQLIGDLNRGYNVDNVDWLQTVTSCCLRAGA